MMRKMICGVVAVMAVPLLCNAARASEGAVAATHEQARQWLNEGNQRYVAAASESPNQGQDRRCETYAHGQHPFAAVLSCADSRVPVETIFDRGIGDLFVIRVAGNIAANTEIGSLEYGVEHLGLGLIVVMGHTKCGAVTAVVENAHVEGHVADIAAKIAPAVKQARASTTGPALLDAAIRANVRQAMADLLSGSEILRKAAEGGKLQVVGAVYDIHSGAVTWLASGPDAPATPVEAKPAKAPAAPADHGAAESHAKPAGHGAAEAREQPGHSDPTALGAGEGHAAATTQSGHSAATQPAVAGERPHNFLALGALLASGGALSTVVFRFMKPHVRKGAAVAAG